MRFCIRARWVRYIASLQGAWGLLCGGVQKSRAVFVICFCDVGMCRIVSMQGVDMHCIVSMQDVGMCCIVPVQIVGMHCIVPVQDMAMYFIVSVQSADACRIAPVQGVRMYCVVSEQVHACPSCISERRVYVLYCTDTKYGHALYCINRSVTCIILYQYMM